jgi:hypothetical protein
MFVALSLRLVMTNGTPWALVGYLAVATLAATVIGFVYTGKTWCNFVCPVGLVEKMYTEPSRLFGVANSQCSPCTACKKNCPDIDLEQGYWKEAGAGSRRVAYFTWPGIVFGFYLYYYLVAGNWDYYFSGDWTREGSQIARWLEPGFTFSPAIPIVAAAPLTLALFGGASFALFWAAERVALRRAGGGDEAAARIRHRALALAGFCAFLVFYFFGGQPTIRLAPGWVGALFATAVVIAATAMLMRRWGRSEADFVQERFAEKLLKRWEWDDPRPARLGDVVIVHSERTRERKVRVGAYKETVREMVADGLVTRSELTILDRLRAQLGIPDREHKQALAELSEEDRSMFDPARQGTVEQRLQRQAYQRDLEHVVLAAASAGVPPDPDALERVRRDHNLSETDHRQLLADLLAEQGPLVSLYREQIDHIAALATAHETCGGESASLAFLSYLCRWRAGQRATRAVNLLAPVIGAAVGEEVPELLLAAQPDRRAEGAARLTEAAGDTLSRPLVDALERLQRQPTPRKDRDAAAFRRLIDDPSPYLVAAAVHVLSRFDDEESQAAVVAATANDDPLVRESAVNALGVRGRLGTERMNRALDDPHARVRLAAAAAASRDGQLASKAAAAAAASPSRGSGVYASLDASSSIDALTSLERMMFLRAVPILATLEPDELEECTRLAEERRFAQDQVLCRQGDAGDEVFLLIDGEVEARASAGGSDHVLGRSGPGSCIGEMAVFDPAPRAATVVATRPTRTLVIEGNAFRALLSTRGAMGQAIIAVLVGRLRGMIATTGRSGEPAGSPARA